MERENERLTASSVEGSVGCLRGVGAGSPEGDLVQMGLDRSTGETGKKGGAQTLELRAGSERRPQRCEQHSGSEGSVGTGRTRSGLGRPRACQHLGSVAQSCLALCDSMDCSTPGFPVHHQLSELTQTHVH